MLHGASRFFSQREMNASEELVRGQLEELRAEGGVRGMSRHRHLIEMME